MDKVRLKASPEQIDELVKAEEAKLRLKLEEDIKNLRKKYEYIDIPLQIPAGEGKESGQRTKWTAGDVEKLIRLYVHEHKKPKAISLEIGKPVKVVNAKVAVLKKKGMIG